MYIVENCWAEAYAIVLIEIAAELDAFDRVKPQIAQLDMRFVGTLLQLDDFQSTVEYVTLDPAQQKPFVVG
ncbi:hypothetical protein D3C84_827820 [compost metagenome]